MKKKILISLLSIVMCFSLITGATFALFTSESKTNIAVSSGKVKVAATIEEVTLYSNNQEMTGTTFELGGTAQVNENKLVLNKMMPMDKIIVKVDIADLSNVNYKFRMSINCDTGNDTLLYRQLILGTSLDGINYDEFSGFDSGWQDKSSLIDSFNLSIEMPEYVDETYSDLSCEMTLMLEAIQGNATTNGAAGVQKIYRATDSSDLLTKLAECANGDTIILDGSEQAWQSVAINYTDEKTVYINGYAVGELMVNAPQGAIHMYNDIKNALTIDCVAFNSFHLYGEARFVTIKQGRLVAEPSSSASLAAAPAGDIAINIEEGARVPILLLENGTNSSAGVTLNTAEDIAITAEEGTTTKVDVDKASTGVVNINDLPNSVIITGVADKWDGAADTTWYNDLDTEFTLSTCEQIAGLAELVNAGNTFEGKTINLGTDLDFEARNDKGELISFRPIGDQNSGSVFKGTFDGQKHTIQNMYQNGWAFGYEWGAYGSFGLFGIADNVTVKNLTIANATAEIEGGDVSAICGSATGTCVFENITIESGNFATYNNGNGGIIGWSGEGNYTFKNITIGEDVALTGLWGSFDSSIGGIVGQAEPGATYNFENVTINCVLNVFNDCTASYDYYNYRMCGMLIGRCEETTTIDGTNYPDTSKYNITCSNVTVNYGDWMNYHYCDPTPGLNNGRGMRYESGYSYDGLDENTEYDHSQCTSHCQEWIPFNQLIGGAQYAVKGLLTYAGVTVNYPQSYKDLVNAEKEQTQQPEQEVTE